MPASSVDLAGCAQTACTAVFIWATLLGMSLQWPLQSRQAHRCICQTSCPCLVPLSSGQPIDVAAAWATCVHMDACQPGQLTETPATQVAFMQVQGQSPDCLWDAQRAP